MYIRVKLFSGLKEPLTYAIPESWIGDNLVGTIVEVPLQKRKEVGIIEEVFAETGPVDFIIREALSKDLFPTDPLYTAYIAKLSDYLHLNQAISSTVSVISYEKKSLKQPSQKFLCQTDLQRSSPMNNRKW